MLYRFKFIKAVAALTAILFTWQTGSAYAFPALSLVPKAIASVDSETPTTDRTALLLLNAHTSSDAQKNISESLKYFQSQGVNLIGLEGADDKIDGRAFRNFPDKEAIRKASWEMVKEGLFTGAEHFYVTAEELPNFYGIETKDLYFQNRDVFVATAKSRESLSENLRSISEAFGALKKKIYSGKLQDFDQVVSLYKEENLGFLDYLDKTFQAAKKARLSLPGYPNLYSLSKAIEREKKISQRGIEKDLQKLSQSGFDSGLIDLIRRRDSVSGDDLITYYQNIHAGFSKLTQEQKINLSDYKDLAKFDEWLDSFLSFDSKKLFDELDRVTNDIYGSLAKSEKEKTLLNLFSRFETFRKMLSIELTQKEWEAHPAEFNPEETLSFFSSELKDRAPSVSKSQIDLIREAEASAQKFYELAEKRNSVFAEKIDSAMKKNNKTTSIIVIGGFHEKGLKEALQARGISTAVISPKIGAALSDIPYMDRMLGKPTKFQTALKTAVSTINQASALSFGFSDEVLKEFAARVNGTYDSQLNSKPVSKSSASTVEKNRVSKPINRIQNFWKGIGISAFVGAAASQFIRSEARMLVLSRKAGEKIMIGDQITLEVTKISGNKARIAVTAPKTVSVFRPEAEKGVVFSESNGLGRKVMTRKTDEIIQIGENIFIVVVGFHSDKVRLGIQAPPAVSVHREEIYRAILDQQAKQSKKPDDRAEARTSKEKIENDIRNAAKRYPETTLEEELVMKADELKNSDGLPPGGTEIFLGDLYPYVYGKSRSETRMLVLTRGSNHRDIVIGDNIVVHFNYIDRRGRVHFEFVVPKDIDVNRYSVFLSKRSEGQILRPYHNSESPVNLTGSTNGTLKLTLPTEKNFRDPKHIVIIGDDDIRVGVVQVRDGRVKLGIIAPRNITIHRSEVYQQIRRNHQAPVRSEVRSNLFTSRSIGRSITIGEDVLTVKSITNPDALPDDRAANLDLNGSPLHGFKIGKWIHLRQNTRAKIHRINSGSVTFLIQAPEDLKISRFEARAKGWDVIEGGHRPRMKEVLPDYVERLESIRTRIGLDIEGGFSYPNPQFKDLVLEAFKKVLPEAQQTILRNARDQAESQTVPEDVLNVRRMLLVWLNRLNQSASNWQHYENAKLHWPQLIYAVNELEDLISDIENAENRGRSEARTEEEVGYGMRGKAPLFKEPVEFNKNYEVKDKIKLRDMVSYATRNLIAFYAPVDGLEVTTERSFHDSEFDRNLIVSLIFVTRKVDQKKYRVLLAFDKDISKLVAGSVIPEPSGKRFSLEFPVTFYQRAGFMTRSIKLLLHSGYEMISHTSSLSGRAKDLIERVQADTRFRVEQMGEDILITRRAEVRADHDEELVRELYQIGTRESINLAPLIEQGFESDEQRARAESLVSALKRETVVNKQTRQKQIRQPVPKLLQQKLVEMDQAESTEDAAEILRKIKEKVGNDIQWPLLEKIFEKFEWNPEIVSDILEEIYDLDLDESEILSGREFGRVKKDTYAKRLSYLIEIWPQGRPFSRSAVSEAFGSYGSDLQIPANWLFPDDVGNADRSEARAVGAEVVIAIRDLVIEALQSGQEVRLTPEIVSKQISPDYQLSKDELLEAIDTYNEGIYPHLSSVPSEAGSTYLIRSEVRQGEGVRKHDEFMPNRVDMTEQTISRSDETLAVTLTSGKTIKIKYEGMQLDAYDNAYDANLTLELPSTVLVHRPARWGDRVNKTGLFRNGKWDEVALQGIRKELGHGTSIVPISIHAKRGLVVFDLDTTETFYLYLEGMTPSSATINVPASLRTSITDSTTRSEARNRRDREAPRVHFVWTPEENDRSATLANIKALYTDVDWQDLAQSGKNKLSASFAAEQARASSYASRSEARTTGSVSFKNFTAEFSFFEDAPIRLEDFRNDLETFLNQRLDNPNDYNHFARDFNLQGEWKLGGNADLAIRLSPSRLYGEDKENTYTFIAYYTGNESHTIATGTLLQRSEARDQAAIAIRIAELEKEWVRAQGPGDEELSLALHAKIRELEAEQRNLFKELKAPQTSDRSEARAIMRVWHENNVTHMVITWPETLYNKEREERIEANSLDAFIRALRSIFGESNLIESRRSNRWNDKSYLSENELVIYAHAFGGGYGPEYFRFDWRKPETIVSAFNKVYRSSPYRTLTGEEAKAADIPWLLSVENLARKYFGPQPFNELNPLASLQVIKNKILRTPQSELNEYKSWLDSQQLRQNKEMIQTNQPQIQALLDDFRSKAEHKFQEAEQILIEKEQGKIDQNTALSTLDQTFASLQTIHNDYIYQLSRISGARLGFRRSEARVSRTDVIQVIADHLLIAKERLNETNDFVKKYKITPDQLLGLAKKLDKRFQTTTFPSHPMYWETIDDVVYSIEQSFEAEMIKNAPVAIVGKLGGTSIAFQAANANGLIGERVTTKTLLREDRQDTQEEIVSRIADAVGKLIDEYGRDRITSVYFTAPGFFNPEGVLIQDESNIPGLKAGFSFEKAVSAKINERYRRGSDLGAIPVKVVHDGKGAALGELSSNGTLPGGKNVFFVIVGTGVGTGAIIDGKQFFGGERVNFVHNEGPHTLVFNGDVRHPDYQYVALTTKGLHPNFKDVLLPDEHPNPFYRGEDLEDRTSGPNIAKYAQEVVGKALKGTDLLNVTKRTEANALVRAAGKIENINTAILGQAANQGNSLAREIIAQRAYELGVGLVVFLIESNKIWKDEFPLPEHVILGSGVAQIGPIFLEAVRQGAKDRFAKAGIKYDVNRIQLSEIEDDTARELFGGLPTPEQIEAHTAKLNVRSEAGRDGERPDRPSRTVSPTRAEARGLEVLFSFIERGNNKRRQDILDRIGIKQNEIALLEATKPQSEALKERIRQLREKIYEDFAALDSLDKNRSEARAENIVQAIDRITPGQLNRYSKLKDLRAAASQERPDEAWRIAKVLGELAGEGIPASLVHVIGRVRGLRAEARTKKSSGQPDSHSWSIGSFEYGDLNVFFNLRKAYPSETAANQAKDKLKQLLISHFKEHSITSLQTLLERAGRNGSTLPFVQGLFIDYFESEWGGQGNKILLGYEFEIKVGQEQITGHIRSRSEARTSKKVFAGSKDEALAWIDKKKSHRRAKSPSVRELNKLKRAISGQRQSDFITITQTGKLLGYSYQIADTYWDKFSQRDPNSDARDLIDSIELTNRAADYMDFVRERSESSRPRSEARQNNVVEGIKDNYHPGIDETLVRVKNVEIVSTLNKSIRPIGSYETKPAFINAHNVSAQRTVRWKHNLGDKNKFTKAQGDGEATYWLRRYFNEGIPGFKGVVVIGEGERDEAPMLYIGERVGEESYRLDHKLVPEDDIALDVLELTNGMVNDAIKASVSIGAYAPHGGLMHAPDIYISKWVVGPQAKESGVSVDQSTSNNLKAITQATGKQISDLKGAILFRPPHIRRIVELVKAGISVRGDPDIAALVRDFNQFDNLKSYPADKQNAASIAQAQIDLDQTFKALDKKVKAAGIYTVGNLILLADGDLTPAFALKTGELDFITGRGGAPEGVLTAAIVKAIGGEMSARFVSADALSEAAMHSDLDRDGARFSDREKERLKNFGFAEPGTSDLALKPGQRRWDHVYSAEELVPADDFIVIASAVKDNPWVPGLKEPRFDFETGELEVYSVRAASSGNVQVFKTTYETIIAPLRSQISELERQLKVMRAHSLAYQASESTELERTLANLYYLLGRSYLVYRHFDDALKAFDTAKGLNPEENHYYEAAREHTLGFKALILSQDEKGAALGSIFETAQTHFEKSLELSRENRDPSLRTHPILLDLYEFQGDEAAKKKDYNTALHFYSRRLQRDLENSSLLEKIRNIEGQAGRSELRTIDSETLLTLVPVVILSASAVGLSAWLFISKYREYTQLNREERIKDLIDQLRSIHQAATEAGARAVRDHRLAAYDFISAADALNHIAHLDQSPVTNLSIARAEQFIEAMDLYYSNRAELRADQDHIFSHSYEYHNGEEQLSLDQLLGLAKEAGFSGDLSDVILPVKRNHPWPAKAGRPRREVVEIKFKTPRRSEARTTDEEEKSRLEWRKVYGQSLIIIQRETTDDHVRNEASRFLRELENYATYEALAKAKTFIEENQLSRSEVRANSENAEFQPIRSVANLRKGDVVRYKPFGKQELEATVVRGQIAEEGELILQSTDTQTVALVEPYLLKAGKFSRPQGQFINPFNEQFDEEEAAKDLYAAFYESQDLEKAGIQKAITEIDQKISGLETAQARAQEENNLKLSISLEVRIESLEKERKRLLAKFSGRSEARTNDQDRLQVRGELIRALLVIEKSRNPQHIQEQARQHRLKLHAHANAETIAEAEQFIAGHKPVAKTVLPERAEPNRMGIIPEAHETGAAVERLRTELPPATLDDAGSRAEARTQVKVERLSSNVISLTIPAYLDKPQSVFKVTNFEQLIGPIKYLGYEHVEVDQQAKKIRVFVSKNQYATINFNDLTELQAIFDSLLNARRNPDPKFYGELTHRKGSVVSWGNVSNWVSYLSKLIFLGRINSVLIVDEEDRALSRTVDVGGEINAAGNRIYKEIGSSLHNPAEFSFRWWPATKQLEISSKANSPLLVTENAGRIVSESWDEITAWIDEKALTTPKSGNVNDYIELELLPAKFRKEAGVTERVISLSPENGSFGEALRSKFEEVFEKTGTETSFELNWFVVGEQVFRLQVKPRSEARGIERTEVTVENHAEDVRKITYRQTDNQKDVLTLITDLPKTSISSVSIQTAGGNFIVNTETGTLEQVILATKPNANPEFKPVEEPGIYQRFSFFLTAISESRKVPAGSELLFIADIQKKLAAQVASRTKQQPQVADTESAELELVSDEELDKASVLSGDQAVQEASDISDTKIGVTLSTLGEKLKKAGFIAAIVNLSAEEKGGFPISSAVLRSAKSTPNVPAFLAVPFILDSPQLSSKVLSKIRTTIAQHNIRNLVPVLILSFKSNIPKPVDFNELIGKAKTAGVGAVIIRSASVDRKAVIEAAKAADIFVASTAQNAKDAGELISLGAEAILISPESLAQNNEIVQTARESGASLIVTGGVTSENAAQILNKEDVLAVVTGSDLLDETGAKIKALGEIARERFKKESDITVNEGGSANTARAEVRQNALLERVQLGKVSFERGSIEDLGLNSIPEGPLGVKAGTDGAKLSVNPIAQVPSVVSPRISTASVPGPRLSPGDLMAGLLKPQLKISKSIFLRLNEDDVANLERVSGLASSELEKLEGEKDSAIEALATLFAIAELGVRVSIAAPNVQSQNTLRQALDSFRVLKGIKLSPEFQITVKDFGENGSIMERALNQSVSEQTFSVTTRAEAQLLAPKVSKSTFIVSDQVGNRQTQTGLLEKIRLVVEAVLLKQGVFQSLQNQQNIWVADASVFQNVAEVLSLFRRAEARVLAAA